MTTFGAIVVTIAVATLYLMALKANARANRAEQTIAEHLETVEYQEPIYQLGTRNVYGFRTVRGFRAKGMVELIAENAALTAALARIEATLGECVEAAEDDGPSSFAELVETTMPREFPDYVSDFQRETATDWCGDFQLVACRWRVADKGFHQTFGLNDLYRLAKTPNYWPDMFAANLAKVAA